MVELHKSLTYLWAPNEGITVVKRDDPRDIVIISFRDENEESYIKCIQLDPFVAKGLLEALGKLLPELEEKMKVKLEK